MQNQNPPKDEEVHLKWMSISNEGHIGLTMEIDNRLSKRVRAIGESVPEIENLRSQEFIQSLNTLLSPLGFNFGDYSIMEFFVRSNTEKTDRALDVWKNFLWEWTTERALPFETTYKHKYPKPLRLLI
jgi:hypothetical protein